MSKPWFAHYRKIGAGGMAEVLLASQQGIAGIEKLVAVKRPLPHLRDNKEIISLFLEEARLAASLKHPNIVEIYQVERDDEGFAMVMEYLSGESLRYMLRKLAADETRLPVPVCCRIAADIADALHCAHTATSAEGRPASIVHRDISPSNIVVTYDGVTKVLDFGLAKADEQRVYSRPHTIKGKLAYISPEQAQHKDVGPRSDLFSLGALLHEMLTSKRLFQGPSQAAIIKNVMERRVTPPSLYNTECPPELDEIVLKLLARDPARRTGSAAELRNQIRVCLQGMGNPGHQELADWMRRTFAKRYKARKHAEQEVRKAGRRSPTPTPGDVVPPLFDDEEDLSATLSEHSASYEHPRPSTVDLMPEEPRAAKERERSRRGGIAIWIPVLAVLIAAAAFGAWQLKAQDKDDAIGGATPARPPAAATSVTDAPAVKEEPSTIGMLLHAVPEGAEVTVNGTPWNQKTGIDPLLIPVPAGSEVSVTVAKPGYTTHNASLKTPRSGTMPVYVTLIRTEAEPREIATKVDREPVAARKARRGSDERATLTVTFTPANATLVVDGARKAGKSPVTITRLNPGTHTLKLDAPGYEPTTRTVRVTGGQSHRVELGLDRAAPPMGQIDIRSEPSGARVQIDGKSVGNTPIDGLRFEAGKSLSVKVAKSGYQPFSTTITPAAGETKSVLAALAKDTPVMAATTPGPQPDPQPPAPGPPKTTRKRDITVGRNTVGDADRGRGLYSRCLSCHGSSASALSPKHFTKKQWDRYLASQRHARSAMLSDSFTASQLADVKAYLMNHAADAGTSSAAGVR